MNPLYVVGGLLALLWFISDEKEKPGEIKKVDPTTKKPTEIKDNPKMKEAYDAGTTDAKVSIGAYSGLPTKAYYGSYKDGESTEWKAWYRNAFSEYLDKNGFHLDEDGYIDKDTSIAPLKESVAEKSPALISTPAGTYKA